MLYLLSSLQTEHSSLHCPQPILFRGKTMLGRETGLTMAISREFLIILLLTYMWLIQLSFVLFARILCSSQIFSLLSTHQYDDLVSAHRTLEPTESPSWKDDAWKGDNWQKDGWNGDEYPWVFHYLAINILYVTSFNSVLYHLLTSCAHLNLLSPFNTLYETSRLHTEHWNLRGLRE